MATEKALLTLPNTIVIGGILIAVTVWLCRAFSMPKRKRIPTLINGLAVIVFVVGFAISVGPHPSYSTGKGGIKSSGLIYSGPVWSMVLGTTIAIVLMVIAQRYAKRH